MDGGKRFDITRCAYIQYEDSFAISQDKPGNCLMRTTLTFNWKSI